MTRIVVVTSGKGGVGKTTTSASFSSGLAMRGHKTAVIDFDVGLRNLDLIMGCERRVVYDFVNVIQGEATLNQALIKDKNLENLFILPASQTRDKDALSLEGVGKVINDLKDMGFEYIVCDEPIKEYLLLTRYNPKRVEDGEMLSLKDIEDILRIKLIGVIPESESVLQASNQGLPAIHIEKSDVSEAYRDVVSRYLGEEKPLRFVDYEKPGLFKRLFGGK